jgi:hypothetical protein
MTTNKYYEELWEKHQDSWYSDDDEAEELRGVNPHAFVIETSEVVPFEDRLIELSKTLDDLFEKAPDAKIASIGYSLKEKGVTLTIRGKFK